MAIKACLPLVRVVAHKPLHLFPGVVVVARLSPIEEKRHGAPAVWLNAKRTYPICPILRRRYLASLSLSRSMVEVRLNTQSGKGDALHFALICLDFKDSPHELCLQPLPQVLIYAPIGIAAFVADFLHRQVGYVASVMLQDKFHSVGVALRRG